ncbi:uncharacterized protein [Triticum aestivum]|uniref:uncharacterized protein n=1 Tax=Triticum aestivum TaxID=4565 RepID=UPI001D021F35|nr:uncharacterized protein LOC123123757 [Triticum aestivum]
MAPMDLQGANPSEGWSRQMATESLVRCSRRRRPEPELKAQHGLQGWSEPRVQPGAPLVLAHGEGGCLGVRTHGGGSGGGSRRKSGSEGHSLRQVPDGDGDLQHGGDGCVDSDGSLSGGSVQWRKQATTAVTKADGSTQAGALNQNGSEGRLTAGLNGDWPRRLN